MNLSSALKKVLAILLILLLIAVAFRILNGPPDNTQDEQPTDPMTFVVHIPSYTPVNDTIVAHFGNDLFPMTKIGDATYQLQIFSHGQYRQGAVLEYGYSRGGFIPFGEPGLTTPDFPRSVTIDFGTTQEDTVTAWKWYPSSPQEYSFSSQALNTSIAPRSEFWRGAMMVDFWDPSFSLQFNSTIQHFKDLGYEWLGLAPPWDFADQDVPILSNHANTSVPSYTDDGLREHIKAFKQAGFKVYLDLQVCCNFANTSNRDTTWWNNWYSTYKDFVKVHADLARETGVDAISLKSGLFGQDLPGNYAGPVSINASQQWDEILSIARTSQAKIGVDSYSWGANYDDLPLNEIYPLPRFPASITDQLDFFCINIFGGVVNTTTATQAEYNAGMERIFTQMELIHNDTGLPIILPQVAFSSANGSGLDKGSETFYTFGPPDEVPVTYNATQQAMIYEALMLQVAKRDYIIGVFPFGTWYVDAPLTVDLSIRGKLAEQVLTTWYQQFPSDLDMIMNR